MDKRDTTILVACCLVFATFFILIIVFELNFVSSVRDCVVSAMSVNDVRAEETLDANAQSLLYDVLSKDEDALKDFIQSMAIAELNPEIAKAGGIQVWDRLKPDLSKITNPTVLDENPWLMDETKRKNKPTEWLGQLKSLVDRLTIEEYSLRFFYRRSPEDDLQFETPVLYLPEGQGLIVISFPSVGGYMRSNSYPVD